MRITPRDISRLASFIGVDPGDKSAIPVKPSMANDGTYNLTVTHPCFYMDKLTRECLVHKAKPCVCREYPFVAFGKGHCTLVDVIVCPVAYEMLKEHFGVCTEGV